MAKQQDYVKTALRLPRDIHAAVHESAQHAERSFNAELITRLRESLGKATFTPKELLPDKK
jgi:hypothetical protein